MNRKWIYVTIAGSLLVIFAILFLNGDSEKSKRYAQHVRYLHELSENYLVADNTGIEKENKEVAMDSPDLAAFQDFRRIMDPQEKRVPLERLIKAREITQEMEENGSSGSRSFLWENGLSNIGGRVRAFMFDPLDPEGKKAWTGGVTGGLWYTEDVTDPATSWNPVDDFWPAMAISCICSDPNDPQQFYVGTGEPQTALLEYRSSCGLGVGILHSPDGGDTWQLMDSTQDFQFITDMAVVDDDGNSVIYAGVASGLYMGQQHFSEPSDGMFRSSDGGLNWEQVLPDIEGLNVPYIPSDIEVASDGRIWVGTFPNINQEGGGVILWSDSGDPGTWNVFDDYVNIIEGEDLNIPGRVMLSSCLSEPGVLYAAIASGTNNGFWVYHCYHIIRTEDHGASWTDCAVPTGWNNNNWAYIAWHALVVAADPNDPSTAWCGGLDVHRTTNEGTSWQTLTDWTLMYSGGGQDYVHGDIHRIEFREGGSEEIIITTDGGVFYTGNGSHSQPVWYEMNADFNTLQYYTVTLTPEDDEIFSIGGMQDNCTFYYYGQNITLDDILSGGDGAYCFIDQNEPDVWITSSQNNVYSVFSGGTQVGYINNFASGNFICPADYDYRNNILYANAVNFFGYNANRLLRLTGIPDNISGGFVVTGTATTVPFTHVKYSVYSPAGKSTLFLGNEAGQVYRIDNAESFPAATEITGPDMPVASVSCIDIAGSEDTLIVTFSNFGVESVWQTTDGGASWENKEGNLPDMPIRWAIYHPHNSNQAMLATEMGVWATVNLQDEDVYWEPVNDGLANVRVDMLKVRSSDNRVVAASHGRGLYFAYFDLIPTGMEETTPILARIYPNPVSGPVNIELIHEGNYELILSDIGGREIHRETLTHASRGDKIQMDMSQYPSGAYLIQIHHEGSGEVVKVVKR